VLTASKPIFSSARTIRLPEGSCRGPDLDGFWKCLRSRLVLEGELKRFPQVGQRLLEGPPLACYLNFDAASHEPVTVGYNGRGQPENLAHYPKATQMADTWPPANGPAIL
jgi:hypothetical protein